MDIVVWVLSIFEIIFASLIIILTCISSMPVICLRRFHQHNNILTLNACIAIILCCLSWLPIYILSMFNNSSDLLNKISLFFLTTEIIFKIQIPFSFIIIVLHRYCSIIYPTKLLFKTKRWIILCITTQWTLGFLLAVPNLICLYISCEKALWSNIYMFVTDVSITSIICPCINILIFRHVQSSSRRVHPQTVSHNVQQIKINRRDLAVLQYMVIMLCMFSCGWAPIFTIPIINYYVPVHTIIVLAFTLWRLIALLFYICACFAFNNELKKYLKERLFRCFQF